MATAETTELTCPYPGLRPFRHDEAYLFFGRDEQRNQLLRKLNDRNFVGVVGTSGCGKSSLVLAGLIPDLKLGLLGPGRAQWQVAVMRPGDRPLDNLSEALLDDEALGTILPAGLLCEALRRGPLSLVELLKGSRPDGSPVLAPGQNLLLVVDQFEEIFRVRKAAEPAKDRSVGNGRDRIAALGPGQARERERTRAEADAFVGLILESVRRAGPGKAAAGPESVPTALGQGGPPLFVILTMRSDFLGDCALFPGLPEALSDSQFLVPRLSRTQRREAIVGPAKVEGGQVEPALINRLLNDMGAAPDQLPLMQHALMRLWLEADKATPHEAAGDRTAPTILKLSDYEAMNGMAGALDLDATRAYDALGPESRRIAQVMFRLLSERGDGRIDTRRLATVGEIAAVAAVPEAAVLSVAAHFQAPDLNLLNLSDDVLDISHESVIRNWRLLSQWALDEAKAAEIYREVRVEAKRFAVDHGNNQQGDRLGPRMLGIALQWRDGTAAPEGWRPSAAWAERYGPADDYTQALDYVRFNEEESRRERLWAHRRRRLLQAIPVALLVALMIFLGSVAVRMIKTAQNRAERAQNQAERADSSKKIVVARSQAIRALSQQLDEAAKLDPFSALRVARSLQANPGDLPGAQDDHEVKDFLAHKEQQLEGLNALLASRTLAFAALTARSEGYPQRAVALGVEAVDESQRVGGPSAEIARDALRQALRDLGGRPLIGRDEEGRAIAHRMAVTGMVGARDGRWVATSSTDKTVMVWDLTKSGRFLRLSHDAPVSGLCLSHDDRWLASFSTGRPAPLWDLHGGALFDRPAPRPITLEGDSPPQLYPTFSRDNRWLLLVGSDGGAVVWDLRPSGPGAGPERHDLRGDGRWIAHDWAISPDSRWLSLVMANGEILLWDLGAQGPDAQPTSHQPSIAAMVRTVTFSEDSRRLAVTFINGRMVVLDLASQPNRRVRPLFLEVNEKGEPATRRSGGRKSGRQVIATDHDGRWLVVEQPPADADGGAGMDSGYVVWDVGAAGRDAIAYPLSQFPAWLGSQEINVFAGKRLVVRGQNGAIWTWDLGEPAGQAPLVFSGPMGPITAVGCDEEHMRIFAVGSDNAVWAWDLGDDSTAADAARRSTIVLRGHDRPVTAMVLSGDSHSQVLVTGSADSEVRRWDLTNFPSRLTNEPQTLRGRPGWDTVIVTPRHDWLAMATESGPPQLRDLRKRDWTASPPLALTGPVGPVNSFIASPDGRWLVANNPTDRSGPESTADAWAWDLDAAEPTSRPLVFRALEGNVATLRASRDGRWLALTTIGDGARGGLPTAAYLRDLADGRPDAPPIKFLPHAAAVEFSPDGRSLVVADAVRIRLVRLTAEGPAPGQHHVLPVSNVGLTPQFSPNGNWLAVATPRGDLRLWMLTPTGGQSGEHRDIPGTGSNIREFRFDPTGRRVFLRDVLGGVRISDLTHAPGRAGRGFELKPADAQGAAISPDGRWFAWFEADGSSNRGTRLFDLSSDADSATPLSLHSPSDLGDAVDWAQTVVGMAFSRDGRWLIAMGGNSGKVWDLARPEAAPAFFSGEGNSIAGVDFGPDRFLTIIGADNAVRIWDLKRPDRERYPAILRHHESAIATSIISLDGLSAITVVSGTDNVARTWRLGDPQLKFMAEETVGRNLTPAEWRQFLYWRQAENPTFPALPTPADEPLTSTSPPAPSFDAPAIPK
jgi:WD40 repeat protein